MDRTLRSCGKLVVVTDPRGLPLAVWVLIGFVISFVGIGGGVLIGRAVLDDDEAATLTTALAPSSTTTATSTTTTAPAPTTTAAPATTAPPPDTGGLTAGLPDGFDWPDPDHPPFPFPTPAEVRGRVEEDDRCGEGGGDDDDDDRNGGEGCVRSYTFSVEVDDEDVTVEQVLAHLEAAAPAAGWTPAGGGDGGVGFTHACGDGCHALVQLEVLEPERRNRGPRLEVVVTVDDD